MKAKFPVIAFFVTAIIGQPSTYANTATVPDSLTPNPRMLTYPWMTLSKWYELHAEDVALAVAPIQDQTSVLNVLPARVVETHPSADDSCKINVRLDIGCPLLAVITRKSLSHLNLQSGQNVYAHIKAIRMAHEFD